MGKGAKVSEADVAKKRKENVQSTSKSQQQALDSGTKDLYKVAVANEEEEFQKRDPTADHEQYCKISELFRSLTKKTNELKFSDNPQAAAELENTQTETILLIASIKKLNRLDKIRMDQNREKLRGVKQQTDTCNLQLQNLLYEKFHLEKEIRKCLQFKSKDEDIDLVPVDQFYKEAPESVSRPSITNTNPHQLKLARLEWELKQRKQLAALCDALDAEKEKVASEINKKQSHLDGLAPKLKELCNAAKPIKEALAPTSGLFTQHPTAVQLLPTPLYFLFVQADAYRLAGENCITVKIEGDEEEVQGINQLLNKAENMDDSDSDSEKLEDIMEDEKPHHSYRKKSRKLGLQERRKLLLMSHPLMVVLTIALKDGLGSITLEFSYLVKLHIVTVKPKVKFPAQFNNSSSSVSKLIASENFLTELFPGDCGEDSPNTANYYQLTQVGIESFNSSQLGLAYVWAQRVCGLNFAVAQESDRGDVSPPTACQTLSQLSIPGAVKAIKRRLKGRITLCGQIQALEKGNLNELPDVRQCFPPVLISELTHCTLITWPQYQEMTFTAPFVQKGFVSERDILYKVILQRGSARLTVAIAIKNCYPHLPPVFALQASYENKTIQASNNDCIRDMEREVNTYFGELIKKTKSVHNILSAQILRLMTNFDILLEASPNEEFPRDKLFIKPIRGRNRARPFKQLEMNDGVFHFTQR